MLYHITHTAVISNCSSIHCSSIHCYRQTMFPNVNALLQHHTLSLIDVDCITFTNHFTNYSRIMDHLWMVHGWHSNSGIYGYLNRGGAGGKVSIQSRCPSMDGPWMDTVTVTSTDTWTEGGSQGVHPWMVHGWTQ